MTVRHLLLEGRAEVCEALRRRWHTSPDQAREVQHKLVDRAVADRPRVGDVRLVLRESVVVRHPSLNVVARRILHEVTGHVEVAEHEALLRRDPDAAEAAMRAHVRRSVLWLHNEADLIERASVQAQRNAVERTSDHRRKQIKE